MSGLLLILQLPLGIVPLIHTGKSESIPSLFLRYLDTGLHVRKWYRGDIWDKDSPGHKSIMQVRNIHKTAFRKIESYPCPEGLTRWDNQFGMVLTQWAFVGLLLTFPEECGLHGEDKKILEDINIVWRGIGYMCGIKDDYNMCSESLEETIEMARVIYQEAYLPVLKVRPKVNPMGYDMGLDVVKAVRSFIIGRASGVVYLAYWMRVFGLEEDRELSWLEKIRLFAMGLTFKYLTRYKKFTSALDDYSDQRLDYVSQPENRKKIYEMLKHHDPEVRYTMEAYEKTACPFALKYLPKATDYNLNYL